VWVTGGNHTAVFDDARGVRTALAGSPGRRAEQD
jgi:hypothetical protein